MCLPGVILDFVYPVNPELTDRPGRSFPTNISYNAGDSDSQIKFCPLVTFCVQIDYLGNVILP